jgi:hypothetical protein
MKYRETQKQEEPKPKKPNGLKCWLVEISLTSGKSTQFYVTAKTQYDVYQKADEYTFWLSDEKLRNKLSTFRLMP